MGERRTKNNCGEKEARSFIKEMYAKKTDAQKHHGMMEQKSAIG
jgi:hypothetical protein